MTQQVKQALPETSAKPTFNELGIAPKLLDILAYHKFTVPTPIQHQGIPAILEGKDILGIAQTGTGKTLAFGLPMIQNLFENHGQGLILVPTRELALQVDEVLQKIGKGLGLKTAVLIGGAQSSQQIRMLRQNPNIVVATPGRLADHLQRKNYSLQQVKIIVLDEADRMLDIGFLPEIKRILSMAPVNRQTMLFSATIPAAIVEVAARYMKMPIRIEVAPSGTSAANVEQEVFIVGQEQKTPLLYKLLADNSGTVLVFSRTKHGAKKITANLCAMGHSAVEIHSNKSLMQRRAALDGFKSGKYRILVATDIAARGIDVNDISLVVNYDLPDNCDDYVHRIGRTGRAGKFGKAVSFAAPHQKADIKYIERLIRKTLPILALPILPPVHRSAVNTDYVKKDFSAGRSMGRSGREFGNDRIKNDFSPRKEFRNDRPQKSYVPRKEFKNDRPKRDFSTETNKIYRNENEKPRVGFVGKPVKKEYRSEGVQWQNHFPRQRFHKKGSGSKPNQTSASYAPREAMTNNSKPSGYKTNDSRPGYGNRGAEPGRNRFARDNSFKQRFKTKSHSQKRHPV